MSDTRSAFVRFRGGYGFIGAMAIFLIAWFSARALWHFDPDFGLLNLLLSIEASMATCFLIDQQSKQYEVDHRLLAVVAETVEDIEEKVE